MKVDQIPKYEDIFKNSVDKIESLTKILLQKFNSLHQLHRPSTQISVDKPCAATNVCTLVELELK